MGTIKNHQTMMEGDRWPESLMIPYDSLLEKRLIGRMFLMAKMVIIIDKTNRLAFQTSLSFQIVSSRNWGLSERAIAWQASVWRLTLAVKVSLFSERSNCFILS